jgi:DnaJ-domain-containing protein 1
MSKRDEYVEIMKQQLDTLNAQLAELETKAKAGQQEVSQKYQEHLAQLHQASQVAQSKMEEIMKAGEDQWETLVAEGEKVQKAFVHSVNYFKSQLK